MGTRCGSADGLNDVAKVIGFLRGAAVGFVSGTAIAMDDGLWDFFPAVLRNPYDGSELRGPGR